MEWVRGERIGHGSWGTVNLAIPRTDSPRFPPLMAVKSCGASLSAMLLHEKSVMEELGDCPQLIRCFGGGFSFENGEKLCNLLLEFAAAGDLADKVRKYGNRGLPESEVRRYTKSILRGLRYIHENEIVHCDLKLQNILLCSSGDGRDEAKIADFGLAKKAGEKRERVGLELRGTPLHMSPEMVTAGEQEAPADVWALGCLVAEMVSGEPAWRCLPGSDVCALLMRIGAGEEVPEIPGILSAEGKDFLRKCFVKDPRKRWTAEMLLNHPFVADLARESAVNTCELSPSPRGPLDFPDWEFLQSSFSTTSWESSTWSSRDPSSENWPEQRLGRLATEHRPGWSDSDSWVCVR